MEKEALQSPSLAETLDTAPTFNIFVGAITDKNGNQEVYVIGTDGNLWRYLVSTSSWTNIGLPPGGVTVGSFAWPTVIFSGAGYAYVLFVGSDGNLWNWCAAPGFGWQNLGTPGDLTTASLIGALNVRDGDVYVYYTSPANGSIHLWLCNWAGSAGWVWTDLGIPAGETALGMGATVSSGAFAIGNSGTLWYNYFGNNGWTWENATPLPSGAMAMMPAGGLSLNGIPNTFFLDWWGGDHLWVNWLNGSNFTWSDLGKPHTNSDINIFPKNMAVIQGSDGNAYVFLLGYDFNVWCWVGQNGSGTWQKVGTPTGDLNTPLTSGVYAGATKSSTSTKPTLFVPDSNGKIWMASWDASTNDWAWSAQPLN